MVTAVSARDSGDLETSKKALEDLLKIAPNDQGVQKLLSDVNAEIEAAKKAPQVDAKPAEAALVGDTPQNSTGASYFIEPTDQPGNTFYSQRVFSRHGNLTGVGFCDGHVVFVNEYTARNHPGNWFRIKF